jgi:hypothetical protein
MRTDQSVWKTCSPACPPLDITASLCQGRIADRHCPSWTPCSTRPDRASQVTGRPGSLTSANRSAVVAVSASPGVALGLVSRRHKTLVILELAHGARISPRADAAWPRLAAIPGPARNPRPAADHPNLVMPAHPAGCQAWRTCQCGGFASAVACYVVVPVERVSHGKRSTSSAAARCIRLPRRGHDRVGRGGAEREREGGF